MTGRFEPRPTRPTGVLTVNGWQLKSYEITLDAAPISSEIIAAATSCLAASLPQAGSEATVGFVIMHHGSEQVWVLADRWHGDVACQHTFFAPLDNPTCFEPVPAGGPTACVWELAVHSHERDAFVAHVLNPPDGPDYGAYLADTLTVTSAGTRELIKQFNDAWNIGDVDGLMRLMSDHPTYRASTGEGPGTDFVGADAVREGFSAVIEAEAAIPTSPPPPPGQIIVADDRAISTWQYPTTAPDGTPTIVEGIGLWTIEDDRIAVKDAYRKSFPDTDAGLIDREHLDWADAILDRQGVDR